MVAGAGAAAHDRGHRGEDGAAATCEGSSGSNGGGSATVGEVGGDSAGVVIARRGVDPVDPFREPAVEVTAGEASKGRAAARAAPMGPPSSAA